VELHILIVVAKLLGGLVKICQSCWPRCNI